MKPERPMWKVVAIVFGSAQLAFAEGTQGAAFLNIPVGGGPAAMGSAYTALATDAYAPLLNPGGLGFTDTTELTGQHAPYLESIHYESVSFVHPIKTGRAIGLSVQYLGTGDMQSTGPNGESLGDFSSFYAAYSAAYGHAITPKLSLGLTGKLIQAKLADVSATAWATDIGAMFRVSNRVQLAAVLSNLGGKLKFIEQGDDLPLTGKLGMAYRPSRAFLLSIDGVLPKSGSAGAHLGAEWSPVSMLALRTGYRTEVSKELSALAGFSAGMGVQLWGQELAYAWLPYGDLGDTHYISMSLRFGERSEKRNLIRYQSIRHHQSAQNDSFDAEEQQLLQLLKEGDKESLVYQPADSPVHP